MISLTVEQAKTALEIIENDIFMSEQGCCDYNSIPQLAFYLSRAELRQRLKAAIDRTENK